VDYEPDILPPHSGQQHSVSRWWVILLIVLFVIFFGTRTAVSWFVENLWFSSLGYAGVFWTSLKFEWGVFAAFTVATFVLLYGWSLLLSRAAGPDLRRASTIVIGNRVYNLPLDRVLRFGGLVLSGIIALITGFGMQAEWTRFALLLHSPAGSGVADPIFGRGLEFYLFTLPALQSIAGWLFGMAIVVCLSGAFLIVVSGGSRAVKGDFDRSRPLPWRTLSLGVAFLLAVIAMRVALSRFEMIFDDHGIFTGVGYTEAHIELGGLLLVIVALVAGALIAGINFVSRPRMRWLVLAPVPAIVCYFCVQMTAWYMSSFIVKPNRLVREQPYISHNIDATRRAFALDHFAHQEFPAEIAPEAADPANNQGTLQNIRLWDWQALRDTLRQIQEIRTYYDFPDVDIDRYEYPDTTGAGRLHEVMLAARELNYDKLPESSRDWINEKLIYTHGYGITMNTVNGFTPEGLPTLMLSNMPIQSTVPSIQVKRPEIYFGQLTDTDVYVNTHQKEFNYPQGESNSLTSYEGSGGIRMGTLPQRMLIAYDRGDLSKVPFSDDIGPDSRLLMRRSIQQRVQAIAPFLHYEGDACVIVGDDGRLLWMLDAYTTADSYPYATRYEFRGDSVNYMRNSVKVVMDAYTGAVTFYVFDANDPVLAAWRGIFPALFKDASAMPQDVRRHVRYPETLLKLQAEVYGLYHMTDPVVFYNREDLWTIASQVGMDEQRQQAQQTMEPNFVLMHLPGEQQMEFVNILPFTPARRNNLIGWIAARSDGEHYGSAIVYNFPKTRLVDGPMQIEARIDQNAQLSGQLTLWNQQGSHVRRGTLLVIPCGKALLYAEPIYLQAAQSPMPELRLVVLALQDKLAYGSSFEAALQSLFGGARSSLSSDTPSTPPAPSASAATPAGASDTNTLIHDAAKDLEEYQRLTAEGKLGDAGHRLEHLKQTLEQLSTRAK
jgi:hypothetical protein